LLTLFFAILSVLCLAACATNHSGGYAYRSMGGSGSSQQQNGTQTSSNQSAQTSTNSAWSSKSSISLGR